MYIKAAAELCNEKNKMQKEKGICFHITCFTFENEHFASFARPRVIYYTRVRRLDRY